MLDPVVAIDRLRNAFLGPTGHIVVTEELLDPEPGGGPTVFDPSRIVDGIELSDDPILRYRPAAYSESIARRSQAQH